MSANTNLKQITVTVNNCELHPLRVTADFEYEKEADGFTWVLDRITCVELVIGDKEGIDITKQVLSNNRAKALLTACAADCDHQIYEALVEERVHEKV